MKSEACQQKKNVTVDYKGECEVGEYHRNLGLLCVERSSVMAILQISGLNCSKISGRHLNLWKSLSLNI